MWLTAPNRIGIAAWVCDDSAWRLNASNAGQPIEFSAGGLSVSIDSSDGAMFPPIDEQFVRGDGIHWSFPQRQASDRFGVQLVVRRVGGDAATDIFELLVSVQTSLLDSNPTLDLQISGGAVNEVVLGSSGVSVCRCATTSVEAAIVLGPHDVASTAVQSSADLCSLQLFGQFLEKGVIRRARPWLVVSRQNARAKVPLDVSRLEAVMKQLVESPLPLD